ncbi:phospholipase D1-like [Ictalurus furcatus]|uniref:phospholipase D1-like n=1 Tax=Ictalurus furcatus TaxID=66913 RepID=UPI00235098A7|nr:phospholipase D1-like [Ictalurus furcatus]
MMECWLVVKDSFLLYMSRDHKVLHVMLFDPELNVQLEEEQTQDLLSEDRINPELQILVEEKKINPELHVSMEARRMNNVLQVLEENCPVIMCIKNASSELTIKCSSYRQARWWKEEIQRLSLDCDFFKTRHLGCFAPPRPNSDTKWYVNGSGYFADLADALENAKEEIFITDWWLSPEIFLKERPAQNNQWRLEQILKRKAEAGVKVYLLLYKEVPFTVSTDSKYSKRTLMDLHNNIKVMRYPNHVTSRVFLWSHHEKLVAIDQSMAFMGGLDLAFGRWDDSNYRLTDVLVSGTDIQGACSVPKTKRKAVAGGADNQNTLLWLGKDYNNFFMKDWTQMDKPFEDIVDRTVVPRIPWRDLGAMVHGKAARDLSRHFIQRWNFTKNSKMKSKATIYPYLLPKSHNTAAFSDSDKPSGEPGKVEATVQVYTDRHPHTDRHTRLDTCAFPFALQSSKFNAFVCVCVCVCRKGQKYRVFLVIPLLPGVKGDISKGGSTNMCAIMHYTYSTINRGEGSIIKRLEKKMEDKWTQYFSVCSLRTHSELNGKPISELVYVHSKLLIADDLCYIIGSANINDRSMMGDRDSELAVLVVDNAKVQSRMNEGEYNAGSLTLALRKECFRVLLGSDSNPTINIDDPVSDNFFNEVWNKTAHENTSTYERVSTRHTYAASLTT